MADKLHRLGAPRAGYVWQANAREVDMATPPAKPVGYVNCSTKGGDSGAVVSMVIRAVPNSRVQCNGERTLQGSSAMGVYDEGSSGHVPGGGA